MVFWESTCKHALKFKLEFPKNTPLNINLKVKGHSKKKDTMNKKKIALKYFFCRNIHKNWTKQNKNLINAHKIANFHMNTNRNKI